MKVLFSACLLLTSFLHAANDLPPRLQWFNNSGYCGEVCFITAGLYYGQYLSQYDVRAIASPGLPQPMGALLLGENDASTAASLCLKAEIAPTDHASFLPWVQTQVSGKFPVAIGVYANQNVFYGTTDPNAGDPEYDHIVTVTDWENNTLTFTDNGLYTDGSTPQYTFSDIPADTFSDTRQQANAPNGPVYSLSSATQNYGIAFTGVIDEKNETIPVRIDPNFNCESPVISDQSNTRPPSMPLQLTLTISGMEPNVPYVLYKYNKIEAVPTSDFNLHAGNASQSFPFQISSGSTTTLTDTIQSDEIAIYRAVCREGMKNRQIDQEGSSNFSIGAIGIAEWQDVSENGKFEAKPTQAQSDSSFTSGIKAP